MSLLLTVFPSPSVPFYRHRPGCDRSHRGSGISIIVHVEGPHYYTRPAGVCALREGTDDGSMGHCEYMSVLFCIQDTHIHTVVFVDIYV